MSILSRLLKVQLARRYRAEFKMSLYLYALALCVSVWLLFKWQNTYWLRRGVRGPAGIPLFGNMYRFFMKRKHFGEIYDEMYQ